MQIETVFFYLSVLCAQDYTEKSIKLVISLCKHQVPQLNKPVIHFKTFFDGHLHTTA